jgi:2-iminobutanoate/2-iminopropanoate deaminase
VNPEIYLNSWNFRRYPIERSARKAVEFGYDGIEMYAGHLDAGDPAASLRAAAEVVRKVGSRMPVAALSLGSVIEGSEDELAQRVERQKDWIRLAGSAGVQILNCSPGTLTRPGETDLGKIGSALATDAHYHRAIAAYRELAEVAEDAAVLLVFEIHMGSITDTAKSTLRILEGVDSAWVKACPDFGNMFATSTAEPPTEAIRLLNGRIGYVHAKNCRMVASSGPDFHCTLETGEVDYYEIVTELMKAGFRGPYNTEYSGKGDPSVPSASDIRYLNSILAEAARDLGLEPVTRDVPRLHTPRGPAASGTYSQAVRAGDLLYLSGQGPIDPDTGNVVGDSFADQARATLENVRKIVEGLGGSLERSVKVNVYLSDMANFDEMDSIYRQYFGPNPPSRTTIGANLADIKIEVDAVISVR